MKNNKQKKEIKRGLKAIWRHLEPFRSKIIILIILGLISAVSNGFIPYITGRFFDALIGLSQHKETFISDSLPLWAVLLGIWAIIQLIANNIDWIMDRLRRAVDIGVHFNIETEGFSHMFRLPMAYHKNANTNGELQKISVAGWRISSITGTIINIAPQFLSIIIGIVLAASINSLLASILAIGVFFYMVLLIKILLPIAAIDSEAHRAWNESWNDSAAAVQQIESVKQVTGEEYEINKAKSNLLGKAHKLWYRIQKHWSNVGFYQRIIVFLTQLTIFLLSVQMVSNGSITVGGLIALNGYTLMFFGPFVSLGYSWQIIQNGITSAAQVEEIFEQKPEAYVPPNAISPDKISGEVTFQNVSFRYSPKQHKILDNLNINIKPGQLVALVGESGVGKSTAISLISGYYFPTEGSVLIDGIDTNKLNLTNLRKHIAVVPQEVALFNDTIMNNIRYGKFKATNEEVLKVAKDAHIHEFVSAFPDRYKTLVGERGIKLSVGQKQRIAIARAILRDPSILILDEPTSALDAKTENIVTKALEKLMQGRTTFVIAHRLSTVRKANKIFVFQKGKIVEEGSHEELIENKDGAYRRFYDYQIGLH
ncbi:MAG: ABC transporter ATP-binding protein [Candidatus Zambryskibacteria bacterium]|nr:ABC transporter ATP-binding protein [Candidatus Zambryskibacteria bacterium]